MRFLTISWCRQRGFGRGLLCHLVLVDMFSYQESEYFRAVWSFCLYCTFFWWLLYFSNDSIPLFVREFVEPSALLFFFFFWCFLFLQLTSITFKSCWDFSFLSFIILGFSSSIYTFMLSFLICEILQFLCLSLYCLRGCGHPIVT